MQHQLLHQCNVSTHLHQVQDLAFLILSVPKSRTTKTAQYNKRQNDHPAHKAIENKKMRLVEDKVQQSIKADTA